MHFLFGEHTLVQNALLEIGESSIIYKHRFKQPSDNTVPLSKLDECLDLLSDYSDRFSHFIHSYSHQHNYILCDRSILCYLVYALVDCNRQPHPNVDSALKKR